MPNPYTYIKRADTRFLVLCDHASNHIPPDIDLTIDAAELHRHIAYDLGAAGVAATLAQSLDCPSVMAGFSRLAIDPNRGLADSTLIVEESDGTKISGNCNLSAPARTARIATYYEPYHTAIATAIEASEKAGQIPVLLSIHSFTPHWQGVSRQWQMGLLWDKDVRVKNHIEAHFAASPDLCIGDNQPYTGRLQGDCLYRHGTKRGLPHCLIELRQDEIATPQAQSLWGQRLADAVRDFPTTSEYGVHHFGSVFD